MTEAAEMLKRELVQLSSHDRAELAHFLIHSLDGTPEADVDLDWDVVLTERMASIQNGSAVEQNLKN